MIELAISSRSEFDDPLVFTSMIANVSVPLGDSKLVVKSLSFFAISLTSRISASLYSLMALLNSLRWVSGDVKSSMVVIPCALWIELKFSFSAAIALRILGSKTVRPSLAVSYTHLTLPTKA